MEVISDAIVPLGGHFNESFIKIRWNCLKITGNKQYAMA